MNMESIIKHTKTKRLFLSIFFLVPFFFAGCEKNLPEGMPRIYPCSITVKQEGSPLQGALVIAISDDPQTSQWPVQGTTDASGTAQLFTRGNYQGAPEGDFVLLISKEESEYVNKTVPTDPEASRGPVRFINYVDPDLSDKAKSPFKIRVEKKKNHFDLDAGKKYRKENIVNSI